MLVVILLLLFSGCMPKAKAEAYTHAEDFWKRYITETADTLGMTYDRQYAQWWCCYARYPEAADFGPHILPDELYSYPVNIGANYNDDGSDYFLNNSDTLAELGEEGAQAIMQYAADFWQQLWGPDYRQDKETYRMGLLYYSSPYIKTLDYRSEWVDEIYRNKYVMSAALVTDPSTIYTAADGSYHVRGIGYLQFISAENDVPIESVGIRVGVPYCCYMELGFMPYSDDGRAPAWEHGAYHNTIYSRFSDWRVSDDTAINKVLLPNA